MAKVTAISRRSFLAAASAAALAGCRDDDRRRRAAAPVPGPRLDQLTFHRIDSEARESLRDYVGRAVLLNVWATWCAPCRYEMPALDALAKRLDGRDVAILGVAIDREPVPVRDYLRRYGVGFARHFDPRAEQLRQWLPVDTVPLNIAFGADGRPVWIESGLRDWDTPAAAEWLLSLTGVG